MLNNMTFGPQIAMTLFTVVFLINRIPELLSNEFTGIKHSVEVSVIANPAISAAGNDLGRDTLTVLLRISAHSRVSDFAGDIPMQFENISLNRGVPFRTVWSDDRCHERRGLPRIWIQRLSGEITTGEKTVAIDASPRHIGLTLPHDELSTEQLVSTSNDVAASQRVMRARTSNSHLVIEVKLVSTPCVF